MTRGARLVWEGASSGAAVTAYSPGVHVGGIVRWATSGQVSTTVRVGPVGGGTVPGRATMGAEDHTARPPVPPYQPSR